MLRLHAHVLILGGRVSVVLDYAGRFADRRGRAVCVADSIPLAQSADGLQVNYAGQAQ